MNRTDRLYAITEELRRAGARGRTSAALAERFEVATRTIKRDVLALQEAGLPIWASAGPGGGYVIDDRATLPPLTFSAREAIALSVALAMGRGLPFAPDGVTALGKLMDAMGPADRAAATALGGRIWTRTPPDEREPGDRTGRMQAGVRPATARVVDEAMRDQVVMVIDYTDRDGTTSERRPVEPQAYALNGDQWFLLAWCRRRRAARSFRLDRIDRAVLTTERVAPRDLTALFGPPPDGATPLALP